MTLGVAGRSIDGGSLAGGPAVEMDGGGAAGAADGTV
jgi:hypothetical protein